MSSPGRRVGALSASAASISPVTPPWTRYVALGDSLTEGLDDFLPDGRTRGWADLLAQHLADRQDATVQYANLAIRGRLLTRILDEQVEPALTLKPDLVSIWGGGNDALRPKADPAGMVAKLEEAVARFRAAGADVLVGTSTDPQDAPVIELTRSRVMEFDLHIWAMARRQGAYVMDAFTLRCIQDWRVWAEDRIHLNEAGHRLMALNALTSLGFDAGIPNWDAPLPAEPPMGRVERLRWNYTWAHDHMVPWVGRRLRRTSSGSGRTPKLPSFVDIPPQSGAASDSAAPGAQ